MHDHAIAGAEQGGESNGDGGHARGGDLDAVFRDVIGVNAGQVIGERLAQSG